jgi:hypothetical protein
LRCVLTSAPSIHVCDFAVTQVQKALPVITCMIVQLLAMIWCGFVSNLSAVVLFAEQLSLLL